MIPHMTLPLLCRRCSCVHGTPTSRFVTTWPFLFHDFFCVDPTCLFCYYSNVQSLNLRCACGHVCTRRQMLYRTDRASCVGDLCVHDSQLIVGFNDPLAPKWRHGWVDSVDAVRSHVNSLTRISQSDEALVDRPINIDDQTRWSTIDVIP